MMNRLRNLAIVVLAAGLAALVGCLGSGDTELRERLDALEAENEQLKEQVDKLGAEMRPLVKRLDDLTMEFDHFETTLVKAKDDLESYLADAVEKGRVGRHVRVAMPALAVPAAPPVEVVPRPYIGFDGQNLDAETIKALDLKAKAGVLVTNVREGSPAEVAGVKKNDVVLRLGDAEVGNFDELKRALDGKKPGQTVPVVVLRGAEKQELQLKLGAR